MTNLLRVAALLAPDDGNGAGGSVLTQNAGTGKDGVQTSGEGDKKGGAAEPTADQKAEAAKLEADKVAKAALEAPVDEKWSPKLEGAKLDDATLAEFRELAKKGGFKAGQAQALVEFDLKRQAAADKAATEGFTQKRQEWRDTLKKDPEFGGANYDKSLRNVQRAMTKFGASPEFKKFADAGAGDHPEFVKFVASVGAALGEDPGVKPGTKPNAASAEDAELRKMFDKSPELFTA